MGSWLIALVLGSACDSGPSAEGTAPAQAAASEVAAGAAASDAAPAVPELPAAEAILDRAAVAMGGKEAIAGVESFYYRGTIEVVGQNIRGDLEIWWKGGDFFMTQAVPGIGEMRAGKQGDEIWSEDPIYGRRKLSGVEAEQHAWASSLLLAAEWQRYFDRAKTVGKRVADGHTIYDVELAAASGLQVVMSFDADTGLQVGQSLEQVTPMGRQPFDVRFEDYRQVDGIEIAFRQVIDAKIQQMVQVITEVRINPDVDESKFAYPRTGADVVRQPKPAAG